MPFPHPWMVAFVATLLIQPTAHGFGATGHKLACGIAYQLLDNSDRNRVDELVSAYRSPDGRRFKFFSQTCVLADIARSKARNGESGWKRFSDLDNWHFINPPRSAQLIKPEHCSGGCVLDAIKFHRQRFADRASAKRQRAEALFLMAHWVGDIHQPLHVVFADDLGGNLIELNPLRSGGARNLHQLWDSTLIDRRVKNRKWWQYAIQLADEITPAQLKNWRGKAPIDWANESYRITTSPETRYCQWKQGFLDKTCKPLPSQPLPRDYLKNNGAVAERQIIKAGVRIAEIIQRVFE